MIAADPSSLTSLNPLRRQTPAAFSIFPTPHSMITRVTLPLRKCFLLPLLFCIWAAKGSAQQLAQPEFPMAPPPDPYSLPPPPPIEWDPLPSSMLAEELTPVSLPAALFVGQAPPDPLLPPPPEPEIASPVPNESEPVERTASEVQVWREESVSPQMPIRLGARFDQTYVIGSEFIMVRILFDPRAAGKTVIVKPGAGVAVDPPDTEFYVDATGECLVSVALYPHFLQSNISVYCDGRRTTLPLSRASLETVEAIEEATEAQP
jgi:hypothetical protein